MLAKQRISAILGIILTAGMAFSTQTTAPIGLPIQITHYKSELEQRLVFAKVFLHALWNHCLKSSHEHTLIEEKLAKLYKNQIAAGATAASTAQELSNAISKSLVLTIKPKDFLVGSSSSAYQCEGGNDNTSAAARYYASIGLPVAGEGIDFEHKFESDIEQIADESHSNAFRLSVAWNKIQPEQGVFDKEAIEYYRKVLQKCIAQGIKPLFVFHHYDVPTWFEDLKGFEYAENGKYFQEFVLYVYEQLAEELGNSIISMCNAPEGPAFKGYFTGDATPGEKDNLHKTHTVIANMYYELVDSALKIKERYVHLKKINPSLKAPYIGTQLNIVPIDPHPESQNTVKDRLKTALGCAIGNYVQSGGTYTFLTTGEYRLYTPDVDFMKTAKGANVYRYHPHAPDAFDWIGINVYSNNFVDGFKRVNGKEHIEKDEKRYTDNPNYRNYPEAVYRAVQIIDKEVATPLGKRRNKDGRPLPIIITENGIATTDDAKRTHFFQCIFWTITQLIKEGKRIEGYLSWASHDNYEWPTKDHPQAFGSKRYGDFAVNFDKESPDYLKRTFKLGAQFKADVAKELFS